MVIYKQVRGLRLGSKLCPHNHYDKIQFVWKRRSFSITDMSMSRPSPHGLGYSKSYQFSCMGNHYWHKVDSWLERFDKFVSLCEMVLRYTLDIIVRRGLCVCSYVRLLNFHGLCKSMRVNYHFIHTNNYRSSCRRRTSSPTNGYFHYFVWSVSMVCFTMLWVIQQQ